MKNLEKYFWGILFIAVGVLFALNIAGVITFSLWKAIVPVAVIFIGLWIVLKDKRNVTGYLFILFGAAVFIRYSLGIQYDFKYIIAAALVFIGFTLIFFSFKTRGNLVSGSNHYVIFGGKEDKITDSNFKGCTTFCMFGGHEIDLRSLNPVQDIEIVATVIFGGTTIFLPENVNVRVSSLPVFGGIENKTVNSDNNNITVSIKALTAFGGIEIRN